MVLNINLLLQAQVILNHFFFVQRWLFDAQIVHDEEIACLWLIDTDSIDVIEVRTLAMDHVAKMVVLIKYVITRVHKYLNLIGNSYFQSYQKDLFLLIEDHYNVFELEPVIFVVLQWNSIELIIGSWLIIVRPNTSLPSPKNFQYFHLFFEEFWIVSSVTSEQVLILWIVIIGWYILCIILFFLSYNLEKLFLDFLRVKHFCHLVVWSILLFLFIMGSSNCIRGDKRPYDCNYTWTYATLG